MKLLSLSLREWRSYEALDLEFPDGIIGVRGPNGAGKTTIAEAIGWALFGRLRPGAKVGHLKRQGAEKRARSSVELVFRLADTIYRVERVVGGSARLYIGDADEPETTQTTATNKRLIRELDMNWETFQRTVFARQKDVAALDPAATPENRKRHVERLLGLERYRMAAEKARSRARDLESELRGLREQVPDLGDLETRLAEAEAAAAEDDPETQAAGEERDRLTGEIERLDGAVEAERERCSLHDRLRAEATTVAADRERSGEELAAAGERLAERDGRQARLAELDGAGGDLDALAEARRRWETLRSLAGELADAEASETGFDAEASAARSERLSALRAERDALQETPAVDLGAIERRVDALAAATAVPSVVDAQATLRALTEQRDEARDRRAGLRLRLEDDTAHLAQIERGGPDTECSVCLRPYGDDLERILDAHRRRIGAANEELAQLEMRCGELEEQHEIAQTTASAADAAARDLERTSGPEDLEGARGLLASATQQAQARSGRLEQLRGEILDLEAQVAADAAVERRHAELSGVLTRVRTRMEHECGALAVEGFDEAACAAAVISHAAAEQASREREALEAALQADADLPDRVARLRARAEELEARASTLEQDLAGLSFDPERLPALRAELTAARADHQTAGDRLAEARARAAGRSQQVSDLREQVEAARAALETIKDRERDVREHQAAGTLLSDFRSEQNLRAWPKLEQGASAMLSLATDGRYADVRLSDDYKLMIFDRGEEHGLERFSGGEQDLANLCLRLSIADWVARERNVEVGFVILDEVFGSQDEERRQRLMGELASLGNRFQQMLVITHVPEIAEACDHQIEVSIPDAGRSNATLV